MCHYIYRYCWLSILSSEQKVQIFKEDPEILFAGHHVSFLIGLQMRALTCNLLTKVKEAALLPPFH